MHRILLVPLAVLLLALTATVAAGQLHTSAEAEGNQPALSITGR